MNLPDCDFLFSPPTPIGANWYLWSPDGVCVGERLRCLHHNTVVGMTIEEMSVVSPEIGHHWRNLKAARGSTTWVSHAGGLTLVCGFISSDTVAFIQKEMVLGFGFPLTDSAALFLRRASWVDF